MGKQRAIRDAMIRRLRRDFSAEEIGTAFDLSRQRVFVILREYDPPTLNEGDVDPHVERARVRMRAAAC